MQKVAETKLEPHKSTIEVIEERPVSVITHQVPEKEFETMTYGNNYRTSYNKKWLDSVNDSLGLTDGFKIIQGRKK